MPARGKLPAVKALLLTNEYPPNVYGGAGVHVEYLSRALAALMDVEVRCYGEQKSEQGRLTVRGFGVDESGFGCPKNLRPVLSLIHI